jgi:peptidyl-prolyl cis-trans isomerase C
MQHKWGKRAAAAVALNGLILAGCQKSVDPRDEGLGADHDGPPAGPRHGHTAQSEQDLDAPLAKIDDVVITVREFQEQINRQSPYVRARYAAMDRKREFLENLVRFEVLAKEAQARGYNQNPDVVRTMKQVMIQKLMKAEFENLIKPEQITEAEMRSYYDSHQAEFNTPEEVRISVIVLRKKTDAATVATMARDLGSSNKGFRELVTQYSVDEDSKLRGGDLRYFARDTKEVPSAVVDAAFAMARTGDVAGPIAVNGKYFVLKQTGRRKPQSRAFEEVKRQIQNHLYRDRRTAAQQKFVDELRKKAKVEVFDTNLRRIRVDRSSSAAGGMGGGENLPAAAPDSPR